MTKSRPGNSKFLKAYNETGILDMIRVKQAVSRADLSKETGLSPTAAGAIVSALMEKGYIHETGTGESRGGRKPVLLELKADSYFSVGIDVDVDSILFVLMDITGKVVHERTADLALNTPAAAVEAVAAAIGEVEESFSINRERLLGIGISGK